jgi:hypothetical protein
MQEMNVSKWAVYAEIVSAVAVVLSLIYVGSEIRQNTLAAQDGSHLSSLVLGHDLESKLWDPEFANTYDAGLRDYSTLRGPQKRQFDSFVSQNINVWEYAFYARDRGVMVDELWEGWDRWFRSQLRQDSWQQVWRSRREGFGGSFQAYVDGLLAGE